MPQASLPISTAVSTDPLPLPFVCSWKQDGLGSACVHLSGELDLSTLPVFRQTLQDAQLNASAVSIDLQELTFVDCSALGAIFNANSAAQRSGSRLALVRGSGQVDRVLELTGLLGRLEVIDLSKGKQAGPQHNESPSSLGIG